MSMEFGKHSYYLRYEHLDTTFQEQSTPASSIDRGNRHKCRHHVHCTGDDSGIQRCVLTEPDGAEQDRGVEHDGVDAGQLLEEGDGYGHNQLRSVSPLQNVSEWMFHLQ